MKLSFIFELLLIFVLIAFAASAVIESSNHHRRSRKASVKKQNKVGYKRQQDASNTLNRFCSCSGQTCNCCREFNIPVVPLKGPGCASLQYLKGDRLAISMSFGDRVLTNTTISGRKPQPVCMPLPGGVSKFCGRVYNIGRQGNEFNACLGLELRALNEVEAALRVSCFRFGPKGLRVEPPQPLPVLEEDEDDNDDDDDDDDDDDFDYDDTDSDYESFSVLDDDFIGGYFQDDDSESSSNNKKKATTTKAPLRRVTRKPTLKPVKTQQKKPLRKATPKPVKATTTLKNKVIKSSTEMPSTEAMPVMINEIVPLNESTVQAVKNNINEMDANVTENSTVLVENEVMETSTQPDAKLETTTVSQTTTNSNNKDEDDDDDDDDDDNDDSDESSEEDEDDEEDPIADAVGDALDDDESTEKSRKPAVKTPTEQPKESKEMLDDIVDSVVDTIAGEESDESRTLIKTTERKINGRQSRDMSLNRLHS